MDCADFAGAAERPAGFGRGGAPILTDLIVGMREAVDAARRERRLVAVRCVLALVLYFACEAAGIVVMIFCAVK